MSEGKIRVGIGGWNFEPWRDNFYPKGWPQARELEYASRRLTAIEINSTYYGAQKPATFAKWRQESPDSFQFSLKAIRFATQRRVLARQHRVATVFTESDDYPAIAEPTADFVYTRIMRTVSNEPLGCQPEVFPALAAAAQTWAAGGEPAGLPRIELPAPMTAPRDVFLFFISGAKERAPHAAMALRRALGEAVQP
ncbi:DUF72 domain-containing protein [Roseateles sp. LKC17W]|uniref:DUF72 domain-containing protein n=1 Tax=Pelomonas margarita TaxID=3299031 RepID=A0ABW7FE55_9BURK